MGRPPMPRVLPPPPPPKKPPVKVLKSSAGTGRPGLVDENLYKMVRDRTPVSWTSLFLVGVAAASAVAYFKIERERRLEQAMGKIVSSESDGWTPKPDILAKRKFVPTSVGWMPRDDGWGAREWGCSALPGWACVRACACINCGMPKKLSGFVCN